MVIIPTPDETHVHTMFGDQMSYCWKGQLYMLAYVVEEAVAEVVQR